MDWKSLLAVALTTNPNVLTVLCTALALPILILLLNNSQNRKLKFIDAECARQKEDRDKQRSENEVRREKEAHVYGSLLQILFAIQTLHARLSLPNASRHEDFIDREFEHLDSVVRKNQEKISDAQAYVDAKLIGVIYEVYSTVTEMQLELRNLQLLKDSKLALLPCVVEHSIRIGEATAKFHQATLKERTPEMIEATRALVRCCGRPATIEEQATYERLRKQFEFVCIVPPSLGSQIATIRESAAKIENPLKEQLPFNKSS
jgi:hypothetical protein